MIELYKKYPNIKKRTREKLGILSWTIDNIKDGLLYFFELYGKYPTVPEVDKFEYLPTARTIQRSFKGMVELRKMLNLSGPLKYSAGETRQKTAKRLWDNARNYEEEFYNFLML